MTVSFTDGETWEFDTPRFGLKDAERVVQALTWRAAPALGGPAGDRRAVRG